MWPKYGWIIVVASLGIVGLSISGVDGDPTLPPGLNGKTQSLSDFGSDDSSYLVVPSSPPELGIVLVPDAFGMDNYTQAQADRLAKLGYIVVVVDMYNGMSAQSREQMIALSQSVNEEAAEKCIMAGVRLFRESPRYRAPRVAVIGWGTGADVALKMIMNKKLKIQSPDLTVLFYPSLMTKDVGHSRSRMCGFFPTQDPAFSHDGVIEMQKKFRDKGNAYDAWFIEAGEKWSSPESRFHNASEDGEAWKQALGYLQSAANAPIVQQSDSIIDKVKGIFK